MSDSYFEEAIVTVWSPTHHIRFINIDTPRLQQLWKASTDLGTSVAEWRDVEIVPELS